MAPACGMCMNFSRCPPARQMEVSPPGTGITGHTLFKPSYIPDSGALGVKVVSVFPCNAAKGLPTVPGTILLLDPCTGALTGLVDGTYVTALRTAAGSGAATRAMAKPDAKRLVVFGAGAQARAHVEAMLVVRPIVHVDIVTRAAAAGEAFVASMRPECGNDIVWAVVPSADAAAVQAAVSAADVVCTCTSSNAPLFDGSWLSAGTHINAVGSYRPDCTELDAVCVVRCAIILDTPAAEECGEVHGNLNSGVILRDTHLVGTLGGVLCGEVSLSPSCPGQVRHHYCWHCCLLPLSSS